MKSVLFRLLLVTGLILHLAAAESSHLKLSLEPVNSDPINPDEFSVRVYLAIHEGSEEVPIPVCKDHPWRFDPSKIEILDAKYTKNCDETFSKIRMPLIPGRIFRETFKLRFPESGKNMIEMKIGIVFNDQTIWSNPLKLTVAEKKN